MDIYKLDRIMFNEPPVSGIFSMDDKSLYGPIEANFPHAEMVRQKRVVPTNIHIVQADEKLWDTFENDITMHDGVDSIELKTDGEKALAVSILSARKWLNASFNDGTAKKALAFFGSIAQCERSVDTNHMFSLVKDIGVDVMTTTYHSGMSNRNRKQARDDFASHKGPALLSSVKAIREGVSINDADTALLLRGYGTSEDGISVELQQHHGRIVRTAPGKDFANLVVVIPPIGKADKTRMNIIRMIRDLMESLGILSNIIEIIENGDKITVGKLNENNIVVHPSTAISAEQVINSVDFAVMEYIKEFNNPLYRNIKESEFDDMINDMMEV